MTITWLKNKTEILRARFKQHFKFKNLTEILSNLLTESYILSIRFDEIYFETKNPKRFKLCLINCILTWIISFVNLLFLISDDLYSLIDNEFVPRPFFVLIVIFLFYGAIVKTDFLIAEVKCNLRPMKLAYILYMDIKRMHKLNDKNYNRLVNTLRILIFVVIYYFLPTLSMIVIIINSVLLIESDKLIQGNRLMLLFGPFYINGFIVVTVASVVAFIGILYYKMRFDQIHQKIKSILPNGKWKFIIRRKEKLLFNLIDEHNQVAVELYNLNMMIRRIIAATFIYFAFAKIVSLYLMINTQNNLLRFFAVIIAEAYFLFGLVLTYLFSQQFNSAHQSIKFIHLIVCRYKMRLSLRLRVKILDLKISFNFSLFLVAKFYRTFDWSTDWFILL